MSLKVWLGNYWEYTEYTEYNATGAQKMEEKE